MFGPKCYKFRLYVWFERQVVMGEISKRKSVRKEKYVRNRVYLNSCMIVQEKERREKDQLFLGLIVVFAP